ncbi:MAG: ribosomal protein L7/L12 [Paludibacteraceae bacterium]|nr:ribosomal protein L7/L12 [Paludibacteraceae bacterium]
MSILSILIIAAVVYVLWFHKFTLEDGTEVKGWLAKNKALQGNKPAAKADKKVTVKGSAVRLLQCGGNKLSVVKAIKDNTTLGLAEAKDAADNTPFVFIHNLSADEAERIVNVIGVFGGKAEVVTDGVIDGRYSDARFKDSSESEDADSVDNVVAGEYEGGEEEGEEDKGLSSDAMGLNIESEPEDFERVFEIFKNDPFGEGWDAMEAIFGWLLLGYTRHDREINKYNVWQLMSDYYVKLREALYEYYKEQVAKGESSEEQLRTYPTLMANVHLLNGFAPFTKYGPRYFDDETLEAIGQRVADWMDNFNTINTNDQALTEKPVAAEQLVRVYTILNQQEDSMLEGNTDMFKAKYKFDFEMPKV